MDNLQNQLPSLILAAFLLILLGGILWYGAQVARPQPDQPPGPVTGTAAMERKVLAIFGMIVAMSLIFLGYGLREPARQAEAAVRIRNTSISRGIVQYAALCYTCHGEKGQGAVVPDSNPERVAPSLNRADLQPDPNDADALRQRYDFVYKTIQRGRPGTPMPAWGASDGGALFDELINELTLMIIYGDEVVTFEGRTDTVWNNVENLVMQHVEEGTAKLPKQPEVENQPFFAELNPTQQQGVRQIVQRGCGSCHVIPNIPGAAGTVGPSLQGVADRRQIAGGVVPNNTVEDMARWIQNPQALKPGTAMPNLGLSEADARAVAEYLYTLKGQ